MTYRFRIYSMVLSICVMLYFVSLAPAQGQPEPSTPPSSQHASWSEAERFLGQMLYVPAYSHIYYYNDQKAYLLAITLSIRNTDVQQPLRLTSVRYFDSKGSLIREYIAKPVQLTPLGSVEFFVAQRDTTGGAGAKFLVEWQAEKAVMAPIVETVMIGISGTQGISFVRPAMVLHMKRP